MNVSSSLPIVAGIASIPSRTDSLRITLESIWDQVDFVELVLNGYDSVPDWLISPRIGIARSQEIGDQADNAKFYGLLKYDDCVYLSLDDDILYPPDYAIRMFASLKRYDWRAAVGVHASLLPTRPAGLLDRTVCCFWNALICDLPCSYVGTGTLGIRRSMLPEMPLSIFPQKGMSDLFVASWLKQQGCPVVGTARTSGWLQKISTPTSVSLWQLAQNDHQAQDNVIRDSAPWGIKDIMSRCSILDSAMLSQQLVRAFEVCGQVESNGISALTVLSRLEPPDKELSFLISVYLDSQRQGKSSLAIESH